jgi:hypothetical protein
VPEELPELLPEDELPVPPPELLPEDELPDEPLPEDEPPELLPEPLPEDELPELLPPPELPEPLLDDPPSFDPTTRSLPLHEAINEIAASPRKRAFVTRTSRSSTHCGRARGSITEST